MSKNYFVSRHQGAHDWLQQEGIAVDVVLEHLDINVIEAGDTVIGSLPVNIVAEVCQKKARYLHLSICLSRELRGKELTAEQIRQCGASLEEFYVEKVS